MLGSAKPTYPSLLWPAEWKAPAPLLCMKMLSQVLIVLPSSKILAILSEQNRNRPGKYQFQISTFLLLDVCTLCLRKNSHLMICLLTFEFKFARKVWSWDNKLSLFKNVFSQSCTRTQALNLHYLQFLESCNLICLLPFCIPITNLAMSQIQFDWIIWWLNFDNRLILWKLSWSEPTFSNCNLHFLSVIIWVMESQTLPMSHIVANPTTISFTQHITTYMKMQWGATANYAGINLKIGFHFIKDPASSRWWLT